MRAVVVAMHGKTLYYPGAAYSTLLFSHIYKPSPPAQPKAGAGRPSSLQLVAIYGTISRTHVYTARPISHMHWLCIYN